MDTMLQEKLAIDKTNWTPVNFGEVVFEPKESTNNPIEDGIEHVVGLEHLDTENIHLNKSASIEESTTFSKRFKVGDVLFGRRRAYLKKAAQASFNGICSGDITVFRAKENLMPELLPFIVNNEKFFDYAIKHSAGGLSPRVKFKDLANYEFLLPPKNKQAKLAELLWAMDEVIERELALLQKIDIIYERFLVDFFENDTRYNKVELGDLVNIKSGDSPSTFNFTNVEDGYPFYKVKDLNESIKYQTYAKEWVKPIESKIIKEGSVIFPKRGAAIMTNKVRITTNDCHIDTNTMALSVMDNHILSNEFLYYFLYFKKLFKIADTSQIPQINNVHIIPYPINLPPIKVQIDFVNRLNIVLKSRGGIESKITSTKDLQKSLINQIF